MLLLVVVAAEAVAVGHVVNGHAGAANGEAVSAARDMPATVHEEVACRPVSNAVVDAHCAAAFDIKAFPSTPQVLCTCIDMMMGFS